MMRSSGRSTPWSNTANGARRSFRNGWAMAAFEYRQAQEIRDAFKRHGVKYLFIGKSGAILLGYPDTTQEAHLFIEKNASNCEMLVQSLLDIGFQLTDQQAQEVRRGNDFVQLKNGP